MQNFKIVSVIPTKDSESLLENQFDGYSVEIYYELEGEPFTFRYQIETRPYEFENIPEECSMDSKSLMTTIVDRLRAAALF